MEPSQRGTEKLRMRREPETRPPENEGSSLDGASGAVSLPKFLTVQVQSRCIDCSRGSAIALCNPNPDPNKHGLLC